METNSKSEFVGSSFQIFMKSLGLKIPTESPDVLSQLMKCWKFLMAYIYMIIGVISWIGWAQIPSHER